MKSNSSKKWHGALENNYYKLLCNCNGSGTVKIVSQMLLGKRGHKKHGCKTLRTFKMVQCECRNAFLCSWGIHDNGNLGKLIPNSIFLHPLSCNQIQFNVLMNEYIQGPLGMNTDIVERVAFKRSRNESRVIIEISFRLKRVHYIINIAVLVFDVLGFWKLMITAGIVRKWGAGVTWWHLWPIYWYWRGSAGGKFVAFKPVFH